MGGRVHRRTRRTTESKAEVYLCAYSPISHRLTGCTWPQPHRSQVDAFYLTTVHLIEGQGYVRVMKEVSCIRGGDCPPASYVTECDKMRTNTWIVRLEPPLTRMFVQAITVLFLHNPHHNRKKQRHINTL